MFQDIEYENQLLLKKEYLTGVLGNIADVGPVHGSGPYRYRNRMDFVTAFGKIGLRQRGSYRDVVDIKSCEILQERSNNIFRELRPSLLSIEGYDYLVHSGYNRYVVMRQAAFTGQVMVNFVVSQRDNRLGPVMDTVVPLADSVSVLFHDGLADLSFGEVIEDVKGGHIEEDFDGIRYRITPNSFFQSNSPVAKKMYGGIRDLVKGRVIDLYSGVGSISLYIAGTAETVTGVEQVPEAVEAAEANRDRNRINNVFFVMADARAWLRETAPVCDTLVLDPPRSGMNPKMIKHINAMSPERIVYMSCNPVTFRENMEALEGYRVETFEAYDMFPQTPHVETLALIVKK